MKKFLAVLLIAFATVTSATMIGCSKQSEERLENTMDSIKVTAKETYDSIKADVNERRDSLRSDSLHTDSTQTR